MAGIAQRLLVRAGIGTAVSEPYDVIHDVAADLQTAVEADAAEGLLLQHLAPIALTSAATLAAIRLAGRPRPWLLRSWLTAEHGGLHWHRLCPAGTAPTRQQRLHLRRPAGSLAGFSPSEQQRQALRHDPHAATRLDRDAPGGTLAQLLRRGVKHQPRPRTTARTSLASCSTCSIS